jgi:hypothetical protein
MRQYDRAYKVDLPLYIYIKDALLLDPVELQHRIAYFVTQAVRKIDTVVNDGGELTPDDQPDSLPHEEYPVEYPSV